MPGSAREDAQPRSDPISSGHGPDDGAVEMGTDEQHDAYPPQNEP